MRLTERQISGIKEIVASELGAQAKVFVFGSRASSEGRGGDLDLLIQTSDHINRPALLCAILSEKISRLMYGRKVDVVINSPSLQAGSIHKIAKETGIPL